MRVPSEGFCRSSLSSLLLRTFPSVYVETFLIFMVSYPPPGVTGLPAFREGSSWKHPWVLRTVGTKRECNVLHGRPPWGITVPSGLSFYSNFPLHLLGHLLFFYHVISFPRTQEGSYFHGRVVGYVPLGP